MKKSDWYSLRNDRSIRYSGRILSQDKWICIKLSSSYARTYQGQVAIITAANLLGRMTPSISLEIPMVPIVEPLPWAGKNLSNFLKELLFGLDPHGNFQFNNGVDADYCLSFGKEGHGQLVHGVGWNAYIGYKSSPLQEVKSIINPFGPAFSSILAITEIFKNNLGEDLNQLNVNCLKWKVEQPANADENLDCNVNIGKVWTVGAGSVGTATLFFLSLLTKMFDSTIFDHDSVEVENLDRSPIFKNDDIGKNKAIVTGNYLKSLGVKVVNSDPVALHDSSLWKRRQEGEPDLIISAGNEFKVRYHIESGFPPIQIYGTTGKNWQCSLIRHLPMEDACSCCLFPEENFEPTECAKVPRNSAESSEPDAALPFLSFAAGLMAAAEIVKLNMKGFPYSYNRVTMNTNPSVKFFHNAITRTEGCICENRSDAVYRRMLHRTKYF